MTNTERYFKNIQWFRKDLREIDARYKPEYDRLERFRDSESYISSKKVLDDQRQKEVDALRREAQQRITAVVDAMERTYMERPSSAPSPDQLRLLETLKMRESIGKDELREAANTLKGCPVAERVLEEIARKNGHPMILSQELSGDEVRRNLQSLRNSAEYMISKLDYPDRRGEYLNSGDYTTFRLDVDPTDEADCLRLFGYVVDAEKFSTAVNGSRPHE